MQSTIKFSWDGPRWAGAEEFIRDVAFRYDLTIEHLESNKRWFTETGRAKLSGDSKSIEKFWTIWQEVVKDYNK